MEQEGANRMNTIKAIFIYIPAAIFYIALVTVLLKKDKSGERFDDDGK